MNNQWQPYTDSTDRQGRSSYSTPQQQQQSGAMNSTPGVQQLPSSPYAHETYQTPTMNVLSQSMAVSPSGTPRIRSYSDDVDTAMEDADPYNPLKYPSRPTHSHRPSAQYIPQGSSRRYSPMQTNTSSTHYPASPLHPSAPHGQYLPQNSSARQSPTRNQYSTPSHSFYSTPSKSKEMTRALCGSRIVADDCSTASSRPYQLPPIQAGDPIPDQYHPSSATVQLNALLGREARSPRHPRSALQTPADVPRGPVPRFKRVERPSDLEPKVNTQPAFRRAHPEGGFISVSLLYINYSEAFSYYALNSPYKP